jgi:hypothetical protein
MVGDRVWWTVLGLMGVALIFPLLLADIPPLLDYPNHLARMDVLASLPSDPILARMYAVHWAIIPNLGLDLLIPPLLAVLPLFVAGRVAIGVAILLPVLGCVALHRATFGVRSYWPLLSAFAAYNVTLRLGFLNFLFAVGVALLATAAWVAWRDARPRLAVGLAGLGAVVAFFCHIMGPALMLLLLGCREIEATIAARGAGAALRIALPRRVGPLAAVFVAPALLFAASPFAGTWTRIAWQSTESKIYGVLGAFLCHSPPLDLLAATACITFIYLCLRTGKGEIRWWLAAAFAILVAGYVAAPFTLKGSSFFSTRFPVMFGFLIFAGFRPTALSPRVALPACLVFVALFCARMVGISEVWWAHNADLAAIRQTIQPVEPGSRVLVFAIPPEEAPRWWLTTPASRFIPFTFQADIHEAALLLIERRAFWPGLFASPDQQPIEVLPPYRAIASPSGFMPLRALLDHPAPPIPMTFQVPPDWRDVFDYVLLLDAGGEPDLKGWARDRMTLLRATDAAALFRIRRPAPP